MADDTAGAKPEIVIIRRKGADEGAAVKGGAWKIAYADFVTAMMAFFLVMWLINASNEATRAQVASYFNPIKLTDTSTGEKGLTDPKSAAKTRKEGKTAPAITADSSAEAKEQEDRLLADPQAALETIALHSELQSGDAATSRGAAAGSSHSSGTADGIGDPFDPKSWEAVSPSPPAAAQVEPQPETKQPSTVVETTHPDAPPGAAMPEPSRQPPTHEPQEEAQTAASPDSAAAPKLDEAAAADIEQRVREQLHRPVEGLGSDLKIEPAPGGAVINLTDKQQSGMFRSGSAEPDADTISLIGAIAAALKDRPGKIIIRGHTDSTPYLSRKYDNWQLSTARAHMTQYMLIRGGLDESRIRRIEGVADREPVNATDPAAPENRRIEILLSVDP